MYTSINWQELKGLTLSKPGYFWYYVGEGEGENQPPTVTSLLGVLIWNLVGI